jgi:hypothetical protein
MANPPLACLPALALAGISLNLNPELCRLWPDQEAGGPLTQARFGMKFPAIFARVAKGAAPLDGCEQVATGDPPRAPAIQEAILADSG